MLHCGAMTRPLAVAALIVALCAAAVGAPRSADTGEAPYRAGGGDARLDAVAGAVRLGVPRSVTLTSRELVVEIPLIIRPVGISGTVDRIEFDDMALNGVP